MRGIHHDTSDEQASEQPLRDISMSLNKHHWTFHEQHIVENETRWETIW
jgi:hypothetical protein